MWMTVAFQAGTCAHDMVEAKRPCFTCLPTNLMVEGKRERGLHQGQPTKPGWLIGHIEVEDGARVTGFVLAQGDSSAGFDRAFRKLGAAPCQGPDAEGACPLISCNVLHYVLVDS